MKKLIETKTILHAVVWILIYVVTVNVGDALSEQIGGTNWITSALVIILSIIIAIYMKRNNLLFTSGLKKVTSNNFRVSLLYMPLLLLAFLQFTSGIDNKLSASTIASSILLMIGVGFLEEVIFRGLLFQAINKKSGLNRAIIITGITFGIGHIVNLLRGYEIKEQIYQIILAVVIGIVLAMLVALTKNIIPGILFHIVFNISGSITNQIKDGEKYYIIAILAVSALYIIYLVYHLKKINNNEGTIK